MISSIHGIVWNSQTFININQTGVWNTADKAMCSFNPLKTIHSGFKHSHYGSSPGAQARHQEVDVKAPWLPRTGPVGTGRSSLMMMLKRPVWGNNLGFIENGNKIDDIDGYGGYSDHSDQLLQEGLQMQFRS